MKKTILMGLFIGIFAVFAMASTTAMSAVYASNDGSRQCSEGSQDDKNCQNAIDNYKKHKDRVDKFGGSFGDGNPNNDDGQERTLENLEDKQP
jgi:hypothetical protein